MSDPLNTPGVADHKATGSMDDQKLRELADELAYLRKLSAQKEAVRTAIEEQGKWSAELAEKLAVSAKAISKWETARGLPDISLLEPLAAALGVSVLELMQGEPVVNRNRSANLLRKAHLPPARASADGVRRRRPPQRCPAAAG